MFPPEKKFNTQSYLEETNIKFFHFLISLSLNIKKEPIIPIKITKLNSGFLCSNIFKNYKVICPKQT